jgi:hypothetical protein
VDFLFVRGPSPFLLPLLQTNDPASEQNASLSDGKTVRVGFNRLTDIKLQYCHRANQNRPDQSRPDRRLLQKLGGTESRRKISVPHGRTRQSRDNLSRTSIYSIDARFRSNPVKTICPTPRFPTEKSRKTRPICPTSRFPTKTLDFQRRRAGRNSNGDEQERRPDRGMIWTSATGLAAGIAPARWLLGRSRPPSTTSYLPCRARTSHRVNS